VMRRSPLPATEAGVFLLATVGLLAQQLGAVQLCAEEVQRGFETKRVGVRPCLWGGGDARALLCVCEGFVSF